MRTKLAFISLGGLCVAIVISLALIYHLPLLKNVKSALQGLAVPSALLDYGKMGKILRHNSLVLVEQNDFTRYRIDSQREQLILKVKRGLEYKLNNSPDKVLYPPTFIRIETNTVKNGRARVFWANKNEKFSHVRSKEFDILSGRIMHVFIDEDLKNIRRIRIDPMVKHGKMVLKTLAIYKKGYEPICYYNQTTFQALRPNQQLKMKMGDNPDELILVSNGTDPFFTFDVWPQKALINEKVFTRKRRVGEALYTINRGSFHSLKSTQVVTDKNIEPFPVISIAAADHDLYSQESGIIANFEQRGREWERPGTFSYFEKGRVRYGANIGLRLHGGRSRNKTYHSFRLYFRKGYGVEYLAPGIISEFGTRPIRTLVLHATAWPDGMPYNTLLAYDITRQMGGDAPMFKLVNFYLNGKKLGLYYITPHQSRRQLEADLGHNDFDMYRFKSDNSMKGEYILTKYLWRTAYSPKPITREFVEQKINVDLFTKHILSIIYCGTTDNCQGTAVINYQEPNPRLYWISWDMDHSFVDFAAAVKNRRVSNRSVWEQTSWKLVYRNSNFRCGKSKLFSRLMNEDPEYRKYVAGLILDLMNHTIDKTFIQKRLQFYKQVSATQGKDLSDYFKMLDEFFSNRPAEIRNRMTELFQLPAVLPLAIRSSKPFHYRVDGHDKSFDYSGWYLENSNVTLELSRQSKGKFSHWVVEDEIINAPRITIEISKPLQIEMVWGK